MTRRDFRELVNKPIQRLDAMEVRTLLEIRKSIPPFAKGDLVLADGHKPVVTVRDDG